MEAKRIYNKTPYESKLLFLNLYINAKKANDKLIVK